MLCHHQTPVCCISVWTRVSHLSNWLPLGLPGFSSQQGLRIFLHYIQTKFGSPCSFLVSPRPHSLDKKSHSWNLTNCLDVQNTQIITPVSVLLCAAMVRNRKNFMPLLFLYTVSCRFIIYWLQLPATVWLAGFFNPQSFLTAIMQSTARKNEWPLDKMCLHFEVTKKHKDEFTWVECSTG